MRRRPRSRRRPSRASSPAAGSSFGCSPPPAPAKPAPPPGEPWHLLLPERVPDSAHGVDQARLAGRLGLPAQVPDVDLERVRGWTEVVAPDPVEDHVAGEHLPRVAQEELEEQELRPRQLDRTVAAPNLAGARVEGQIGEGERLVAPDRPPEKRPESRQELLERERL